MNRVYHIPTLADDVIKESNRQWEKGNQKRAWAILSVLDQVIGHFEEELTQDYEIIQSRELFFYADNVRDDEIAYLFWELGCRVETSYDDVGNETYTIYMPETEEEYKENLAEYKKAVMADDM